MKETLCREIIIKAHTYLNQEQIEKLRLDLAIVLNDFSVTQEEHALALPMDINEKAIKMFFVAKKIEGLSEKTLAFYMPEIRQLIEFIKKPLDSISTDDIRYYLAVTQQHQGYTNVTLDNKRRIFSSFFGWLTSEEYIPKNPMLKIKKPKIEKYIKNPFSEDEIEKLRFACDVDRDKAIFEVLLSTGMRVGELTGCDRDDLNMIASELKVYGKGKKERVTYLNPKAKFYLKKYLDSRTDDNNALFVSILKPHSRLQISGAEILVRKLGKTAGVKDVHPHRFRRTAATLALGRGMPVEQVQQMLGHEQIDTTLRYAIVSRKNVKASHEKYLY